MTKLDELFAEYGQSPWIDNIRRDWLNDGTLAAMVAQGVRGVTSNPSIFAKTLATSTAYDELLEGKADVDVEVLFEELAVRDVRDACDQDPRDQGGTAGGYRGAGGGHQRQRHADFRARSIQRSHHRVDGGTGVGVDAPQRRERDWQCRVVLRLSRGRRRRRTPPRR